MASAVLVIDVQQELCEGPDAPWAIDRTIANINAVTARARAAGVPVVLIQHEGQDGYLTHGSPGWALERRLVVAPADLRLRKTATDSFHRTELEALLRARGVTELVICGIHTEFCVDTTTRRALALGFPVTLVADGHSSAGHPGLSGEGTVQHHNHVLANISSFGPRAVPVPAARVAFPG
ncbi:MAG: cysteine hydrolase [Gemmatimonadaceae bacterium]|nr:cysteine hydrolase [Gemmatimonadaceae bacterium]